eukprot:GHVN01086781.1.p2 GENE.GHVN01086781.1~~GHVN01086781.1.p2  ORF type:complete len:127 (-),score=2.73 GHVN01086781.1:335-715(-)
MCPAMSSLPVRVKNPPNKSGVTGNGRAKRANVVYCLHPRCLASNVHGVVNQVKQSTSMGYAPRFSDALKTISQLDDPRLSGARSAIESLVDWSSVHTIFAQKRQLQQAFFKQVNATPAFCLTANSM